MVQITAREVGRNLEVVLGDVPAEGDDDERMRIVVPPVSAAVGAALFTDYNRILFARAPVDVEAVTKRATMVALGAWFEEPGIDDAERSRRQARWDAVQALRWEEGELVCQAALYWNIQGGGRQVVDTLFSQEVDASGEALGGPAKAQEAILQKAGLLTAYSRLMMLLGSESESPIPSPDGSPVTPTLAGTSKNASGRESAA